MNGLAKVCLALKEGLDINIKACKEVFMILTKDQEEILQGKNGDTMAKVMETMIRYGELFNADKMVPITSEYHHFVTSFGLKAMTPIYDLLDFLIEENALPKKKFSVDPRPIDPAVPANFLQKFVFKNFMYTKQNKYEEQLKELGILDDNAYTCTAYMDEVGNTPKKGDVLSWSESSAVVYANSVLGARCNRNSGIIDIMGAIVGYVPNFDLLTDEGRKADWVIEIKTQQKPEAQLLGSAIGMKVLENVPYVIGLDQWIGDTLNDDTKAYLKDFGAATASNGAVGLYHIENLTPEAKEQGKDLIKPNAKHYIIDDAELERVYANYPIIWKDKNAKPKLCFIGCPHLSIAQLIDWTNKVSQRLAEKNLNEVSIPTVFTAAPDVIEEFNRSEYAKKLEDTGIILSYLCPLMYMNNPLCGKEAIITSSNKLRTYTSARYYTDEEILLQITGGK